MIMTAAEMAALMTAFNLESGVPFAYVKFSKPPTTNQYIVWIETGSGSVPADGTVLIDIGQYAIEYYSKQIRDFAGEAVLEQFLTEQGVYWQRISSTYLDDENVHITVYNV